MAQNLNDTILFVRVAELGSFTAAAKSLEVPKATLSRRIGELEQRLGVRLLKRTTRKLGLTEAGALYYESGRKIAQDLSAAEAAIGQLNSEPRGWLRFSAPHALGATCITPLLPAFMARYPDLRVEMVLGNDPSDVIGSDVDVALSVGPLQDSTLRARELVKVATRLYASPEYLQAHGTPKHPDELIQHRTLAKDLYRNNGRFSWSLHQGARSVNVGIEPVLIANDPQGLLNSTLSGLGICLLANTLGDAAAAHGRLINVLPEWSGDTVSMHAVLPPGRMESVKERCFIDFLIDNLNLEQMAARMVCFQMFDQCPESGPDVEAPHIFRRSERAA